MAQSLDCMVESLPVNYLGFLLGGNQHSISFQEPLIDKFRARLDKWRGLLLWKGGRLTLAQLVLNGLPIYFFFLRAPSKVKGLMEKLMRILSGVVVLTTLGVTWLIGNGLLSL